MYCSLSISRDYCESTLQEKQNISRHFSAARLRPRLTSEDDAVTQSRGENIEKANDTRWGDHGTYSFRP
jgi:hypothetical protein